MNCQICKREMVEETYDEHHFIPVSLGGKGKEKIKLHYICHDKLHHTFTEREMANFYHTIERILENEQIQKFIKWVRKKDITYYSKNKDTHKRKKERRYHR